MKKFLEFPKNNVGQVNSFAFYQKAKTFCKSLLMESINFCVRSNMYAVFEPNLSWMVGTGKSRVSPQLSLPGQAEVSDQPAFFS